MARGYAERIVRRSRAPARRAAPCRRRRSSCDERAWFNPELESRNYNVPAVIGAIMLLICLLLTSLAVVREREIGTLEQLLVSPLRAGELILGKTIPFALLGLVDLALVTTVALLWFEIPFRGSVAPAARRERALHRSRRLALGLLISTFSNTQQEAFMSHVPRLHARHAALGLHLPRHAACPGSSSG